MGNAMAFDVSSCGASGNDVSYLQECAEQVETQRDFELQIYDKTNNDPEITCDNNGVPSNVRVLTCEKAFRYIW